MGNAMTVTAFCKLTMDGCTMRFSMAILACRQLAVGRMALGTGKGGMFCLVILQQLICLCMTAGTDLFALGDGVGDFQRGVDRMAGQTVRRFQCCHRAVIFMAFRTLGDTAVFL